MALRCYRSISLEDYAQNLSKHEVEKQILKQSAWSCRAKKDFHSKYIMYYPKNKSKHQIG